MRQSLFKVPLLVLCSVCLATPCWADLTGGLAAYERHEYQTAIKEFRSLANQGNSLAQFMLG
ncbi:MAG: sel1 repeat family protein, partial [Nitrospirota bacterium]|nr:sel1 repeat family protein [Nitrospirota bacterium]